MLNFISSACLFAVSSRERLADFDEICYERHVLKDHQKDITFNFVPPLITTL
jgi:hypothetical protein